ncbi:MAG: NADH-ubiquinone oxidoreductase-F iron-sulfur binding region domain-containing protein, partial [Pseudomonadales bacterium]
VHIVKHGADWFKSLGRGDDAGTKLFGASGRVKKPGCWELPMGTPVREILEEYAGGMQDGYKLKGFLPGGGSTDFLTPEHLDLPMDYDVIMKAGSRMGTGTMIILDDKTCPVGMVANLEMFFARESCGFCTPCREGLPWVYKILKGIEQGKGTPEDLEILEEQIRYIGPIGNTHCAHAPGAIEPLSSAMNYFGDEFKQHVDEQRCPYDH